MTNEKDGFDVDAYRRDVSKALNENIIQIIQDESAKYGDGFGQALAMHFLKNYIATLLYGSLKNPVVPDGMSVEDATVICYRQMKEDIQNAICDAFSGAMKLHNPEQELEYFCDVFPLPEPLNDKEI